MQGRGQGGGMFLLETLVAVGLKVFAQVVLAVECLAALGTHLCLVAAVDDQVA